jgi:hypothetical protein
MSLPKITGPMTGHEAKVRMDAGNDSFYVVALAVDHGPWYNQEWGTEYDLIRGEITVWKD